MEAVEQISANYFTVNISDTIPAFFLENLLKLEFEKYGIDVDYQYIIYDCFTDSVISKRFSSTRKEKQLKAEIPLTPLVGDSHKIGVYFPEKDQYILSQMRIMIYISGGIIIVVLFFAYIIFVFLRQKKLSEIKNDFVNNMTHELKTPISTILLSGDAILKPSVRTNDEKFFRYAGIIREEILRLRSLVDNILELSLADESKLKLNKEEINFHLLIESVVEKARINIEDKKGILTLKLSAQSYLVEADKRHLENVIFNLLDNAIKYCEKSPNINITTYNQNSKIILSIKDNGIGISKSNIKQIFQRFYRVPTGNIHNVKGFGLGLHYVDKIVRLHKAKIEVVSKEKNGTEFILKWNIKKL
jgi:two-component system phosphate regulon sensor histidine kinase PhoR